MVTLSYQTAAFYSE